MIRFYQEHATGDYLVAVWPKTRRYPMLDGRGPALAGQVASVQGTMIDPGFLRAHCRAVPRAKVPEEWLYMLVGHR